jgi:phosphoserine phosphatase RsbU/P
MNRAGLSVRDVPAPAARPGWHVTPRASYVDRSATVVGVAASPDPSSAVEERLRRVQSVADAALSGMNASALLTELLERVREAMQADTAAVMLIDHSTEELVAIATSGLDQDAHAGFRTPIVNGHFAGRVTGDRRPVILDRVDETTVRNPFLLQKKIKAVAGVPLLADGTVLGVLHVGSLETKAFTSDDVALLQLAADRAALAVQALASRADHEAATALQRSLAPGAPPKIAGADISARYVPGKGSVGGDWYDVFPLPSGEPCVVVGDVAGSGLRAAVIMGRMRSSLRSYALETADPAEILSRLDRKMQYFEPDAMATVACAVFDRDIGQARISLAGHLPPAIAVPGKPAELIEMPGDLLIGACNAAARRTATVHIPPGALVCFYTDGLVERRGRLIDDGFAELCANLTAGPPDHACSSLMTAMLHGEPARDDVALLIIRRPPYGC